MADFTRSHGQMTLFQNVSVPAGGNHEATIRYVNPVPRLTVFYGGSAMRCDVFAVTPIGDIQIGSGGNAGQSYVTVSEVVSELRVRLTNEGAVPQNAGAVVVACSA